jgi:HEAT repeat protein
LLCCVLDLYRLVTLLPESEPGWLSRLAHPDPEDVPRVVQDLRQGPSIFRPLAVAYLGALGPDAEPAVPALSAALHDSDPQVRSLAALTLGKIGPAAEPAIPALVDMLKESDPRLRAAAATALGLFGPGAQDAIPALTEALRDSDDEVRRSADGAIRLIRMYDTPLDDDGKQAARAKLPELTHALRDADPRTRYLAASFLGQLGPEAGTAIPALRDLLGDDRAYVRRAAREALKKIDRGAPDKARSRSPGESHSLSRRQQRRRA